MKLRALVVKQHLPQNFCHTHRHIEDRHFPEIVKSCSGHHKTCKSFKKHKVEIFHETIQITKSKQIEESKKS